MTGWHFRRFPNISINRFRVDTESLKNLADAPVFPQQTDYEMTRTQIRSDRSQMAIHRPSNKAVSCRIGKPLEHGRHCPLRSREVEEPDGA